MYEEISTVKDSMGLEPSLDSDLEKKIRLYLTDTLRIGMPRSMSKFLTDIQVYLTTFGIHVPRFRNNKPGIYSFMYSVIGLWIRDWIGKS